MAWGCLTYVRAKYRKSFGHFVCHHKAGAGCYARLLKLGLLAARGGNKSRSVFIDCDDLRDLDKLFDYVKLSDLFVVLCSRIPAAYHFKSLKSIYNHLSIIKVH